MRTATVLVTSLLVALATIGPVAASTGDGATLGGLVWLDADGDGAPDDGEVGRADVRISLRTSSAILDATTTDNDGTWTLSGVRPGTYTLVVEPPIDHVITGGTLPGLDAESGEASITVGDQDLPEVGVVGLGSPVEDGPDAATTVTLDPEASNGQLVWQGTVHNLGPGRADGPIDLRLVLSPEHESAEATGEGWSCEASDAIVLCTTESALPAGGRLPIVRLTTDPVGDVGERVTVTATVRLDGVFDGAPLNDEDAASATINASDAAATDTDGDGDADLTDAGAPATGLLVAALLALVAGAASLGGARRPARSAPDRADPSAPDRADRSAPPRATDRP